MTEIWPEVMVTAHRKLERGIVEQWLGPELRRRLSQLVDEYGLRRATCGMAPGGDHEFGLAVMDLGIPLRAAIPYPSQPHDGEQGFFGPRWTRRDRQIWEQLYQYAEATGGVEAVSDTDPRTFSHRVTLLHNRNNWMLKHDDQVIGLWSPDHNPRSGTTSCLRKAVGAGFAPILFNLAARRVTRPEPKHWAQYLDMPSLARARPMTDVHADGIGEVNLTQA